MFYCVHSKCTNFCDNNVIHLRYLNLLILLTSESYLEFKNEEISINDYFQLISLIAVLLTRISKLRFTGTVKTGSAVTLALFGSVFVSICPDSAVCFYKHGKNEKALCRRPTELIGIYHVDSPC